MSKIKINENQFLGKAEYSRLISFLQNDGIDRKFLLNSNNFGMFEDFFLPEFGQILKKDCFYVRKSGTPYDEVVVQKGVAVDVDGNILYNKKDVNISIPPDNNWYWVKIKHSFSNEEEGTVNIDQFGNLTGFGTKFTEILRGQPNFPTKIKLINSQNGNVFEYEVVKIINDTSCVLFGDFNSETNLKFSVVGTFTPGFNVPNDYKNIYQFDSVSIELIQETNLGEIPTYVSNKEFFLSRVRNNGSDVILQDKRVHWYKTNSANKNETLDRVFSNPLIGVEAVKYDVSTSSMEKNIVELAFGFRTSSFTIDTSSKKVSILIGTGGLYKSTAQFISGKFNGWRLYWRNGEWSEIIDSQKSGTQIVLTLDVLNPDNVIFAEDQLFIAPPYEEVEIKCKVPGITSSEVIEKFNINTPLCRFKLNSFDGCVMYNMLYRYKTVLGYTEWNVFPNDEIGHYNETSFQQNGDLKPLLEDRTQIPYEGDLENGFIKVCENPNSFQNFQQVITTGDVIGVNTTSLDNAIPIIQLHVGSSKKYQHFKGDLSLDANMYINLNRRKSDGTFHREGNEFFLHIEQFIVKSNPDFKILIVEDFVNPTSFTLIKEITDNDIAFIKNNVDLSNSRNGLFITCTFNESNHWVCSYVTDITPKGTVRMLESVPSNCFNLSYGIGIKSGYFGWQIMSEMNSRFVQGTVNLSDSGTNPIRGTGGTNQKVLTIQEMPNHGHGWKFGTERDDNSSGSSYEEFTLAPGSQPVDGAKNPIQKTGGSQPFDNRPAYMNFVFIKKIV